MYYDVSESFLHLGTIFKHMFINTVLSTLLEDTDQFITVLGYQK